MDHITTDIHEPPVALEHKQETDAPNPIEVVRSSKFWFEDGNIVIQAEHTQYRLHRSVLSMHSPIFQDMFACPQPENGPTIDGCPLVHLPETWKDVDNFVNLLYDSIKTYIQKKPVSVSLLRTMLHFGRKYEMKTLRREAVRCLLLQFPSTLHEWSEVSTPVIDIFRPSTSLFEILCLAHEHSITSILPALYLRICLVHDIEEITEGFQHVSEESLVTNRLFINCLLGRERLHRSVTSLTLAWLRGDSLNNECKTAKQCRKEKSMLITVLWNNKIEFSLDFAVVPWEHIDIVAGLCSSCHEAAKVAYYNARIINWDELKTYFRLHDVEGGSEVSDTDSESDSSTSAE